MAGWSRKKRVAIERRFYQYLGKCWVNSKDAGRICLGESLYDGQRRAITEIFDALEDDIHNIYILKSRQLGISTIIRALVIFLQGVLPGLKGAIVFDTDGNKNESRAELETMIQDLPPELGFPRITSNNRAGITLENDSKVLFMSAGVKKSKTSGTLGRSVGLSLAHVSELCSIDNDEGLEAFQQSLSEINPDRLYIYESTARGFNRWYSMWQEACKDTAHCKCIFLGWWSKESQMIPRTHSDFVLYGEAPPNEREAKRIADVKEKYDHEITPEQLAWVRRKMDPTAIGDRELESEPSSTRLQEQAWTEDDAFQMTGAVFFAPEKLTDLTNNFVNKKFTPFMYIAGAEFSDMRIYRASNLASTELKVWEEPDLDGTYVVSIDPAYGSSEKNCRSSIEVFRCYADGLDQVAEYAWPLISTYQLAWVIASLMGWYGQGTNQVRYILELNGPGTAVFNELRSLRAKIDGMYKFAEFEERGLRDVFRNVRTYIYTRADSMGAGFNYHFVTNTRLKVTLMERLRDMVSSGVIRLRSLDLVKEMATIAREGDSIGAQGSLFDDRVMAAAMAVHCWEEKCRRDLIAKRRTRDAEAARKRMSVVDQVALFNQNHLDMFFKAKQGVRQNELRALQRNQWRRGGRRY